MYKSHPPLSKWKLVQKNATYTWVNTVNLKMYATQTLPKIWSFMCRFLCWREHSLHVEPCRLCVWTAWPEWCSLLPRCLAVASVTRQLDILSWWYFQPASAEYQHDKVSVTCCYHWLGEETVDYKGVHGAKNQQWATRILLLWNEIFDVENNHMKNKQQLVCPVCIFLRCVGWLTREGCWSSPSRWFTLPLMLHNSSRNQSPSRDVRSMRRSAAADAAPSMTR